MSSFPISARKVMQIDHQLVEAPPHAPLGLDVWITHAFFVPRAKCHEVWSEVDVPGVDVSEAQEGCWVYGTRDRLELVLKTFPRHRFRFD